MIYFKSYPHPQGTNGVWDILDVGPYGKMYTGVMIGNLPEIKIAIAGASGRQSAESATAFGYGFGGGMVIKDRFDLGVRYFTAEPEYEVTFK